jgi:hypothetical protein
MIILANAFCSPTGLLSVEMQSIGVKIPEKEIVILKEALEGVVVLVSNKFIIIIFQNGIISC